MFKLSQIVHLGLGKSLPSLKASMPSTRLSSTLLSKPVDSLSSCSNLLRTVSREYQTFYNTLIPRFGVTSSPSVSTKAGSRFSSGKRLFDVNKSSCLISSKYGSSYVQSRIYSTVQSEIDSALKTEEIEKYYQPKQSIFDILNDLFGAAAFAASAVSIYQLHTDFNKDRGFTYVSYLAFVPYLNWIPYLDLAQLDRLWLAVPLSGLFFFSVIPQIPLLAYAYIFGTLTLTAYRNMHFLSHYEQLNWPNLIMTFIRPLAWIVTTSIPVIGADKYQLVPQKQAAFSEWAEEFTGKLDESVLKPEIISQDNYTFRMWNWIWLNIPGVRDAPAMIKGSYYYLSSMLDLSKQTTAPRIESKEEEREEEQKDSKKPE